MQADSKLFPSQIGSRIPSISSILYKIVNFKVCAHEIQN
jgi:hypothetical protein